MARKNALITTKTMQEEIYLPQPSATSPSLRLARAPFPGDPKSEKYQKLIAQIKDILTAPIVFNPDPRITRKSCYII
jgi:hypothetical protein